MTSTEHPSPAARPGAPEFPRVEVQGESRIEAEPGAARLDVTVVTCNRDGRVRTCRGYVHLTAVLNDFTAPGESAPASPTSTTSAPAAPSRVRAPIRPPTARPVARRCGKR